jgi:hypothetical protein
MPDFPTLRFSSERDLQNYCLRVLRSKGIQAKDEVWNGDIRADIVTSRAVIECKKILDREAIYQAYGQASAYQRNLRREEIWIVGQYPTDPTAKAQAIKIAKEVEKNATVTVSFIEDDEFWKEDHSTGEWELWRYICLFLGLVFIALAFANWSKPKCSAASRSSQGQQQIPLEKRQI